jgi:hypothetical protein
MSDSAVPFSRPFAWERVQPRGTPVTIDADAAECAAVAEALGILEVRSVHAEFLVTPWRKTGFRVAGEVIADVAQACVVTLDPVPEHIAEAVDLRFLPASEIEPVADDEIEIDIEAEDPPEAIEGSAVDLGLLAVEFVAIGLDPYPRAPGVEFQPFIEDDGSDDAPASPFAALAALRDEGGKKDG